MIKNIILIPGLNGKFDSFSFNVIINWALKHNIPLSKLTFSKYKTSEKFSSTFKEQIKELEDQIKDDGKDFLIVAKSLGCIPALLCQSKANKLLVSPPVIITQTNEKLLEMKFSDSMAGIEPDMIPNNAIVGCFARRIKKVPFTSPIPKK